MSGKSGNTIGKVVGETPRASVPADKANPPLEESGREWLDNVQIGLDVVGLAPVVGEIADGINGVISLARGDYVGAALSFAAMIPFAGWGATAGKGARKVAQHTAKETAEEVTKRAAQKTTTKSAEEATAAAGKAKKPPKGGDTQVKSKKKQPLKCADSGKYGNLKKKNGNNQYDRDHIPSKEALKQRAIELNRGKLKPEQIKALGKAIEKAAWAIAIPKAAHQEASPTYGQGSAQAKRESRNLARAARRDVGRMRKNIGRYNEACAELYRKATEEVLKRDNAFYDKMLREVLKEVKGVK